MTRKSLSKNRIYVQTPQDWYKYRDEYSPDMRSSRIRNENDGRWSFNDTWNSYGQGRKIVFDKMFNAGGNRNPRKGMIIDERPPVKRVSRRKRPELHGNLSLDNLRDQSLGWREYRKISWNEILHSQMEDVNKNRVFIQTLPQKEHWLASIDNRNPRIISNRGYPPHVSPRLFNNHVTPSKAPLAPKYISKDRQGNLFYIVGPGDVTSKEIRPFVLPEIKGNKAPPTPEKLNF